MKKFFLFAAAAIAAMTVNAKVWDFSKDTINTVEAVNAFQDGAATFKLNQKTSSDQNPYVAVDYDLSDKAVAVLNFVTSPVEIKFEYANSQAKTEVLKLYGSYLQINRKGAIMTIAANAGDQIKLYYKLYGKATEFAVTGAEPAVVATEKDKEGVITVTANANEVIFDTSAPSDGNAYAQACQLTKIEVGASSQGINNTNASAKAVKRIIDGQVVVERDGRFFNLLGAEL